MGRIIRIGTAGLFAVMASLMGTAAVASPRPVAAGPASFADHQRQCAGKDGWTDTAPPVRIFGNVYAVGTCGIVVLLITGSRGHIMIDAAPAEAAPSIMANIKRLGFRPSDIRFLLSSHEHIDHAGGFQQVQRMTGATLLATAAERSALESGTAFPNDPQAGGLEGFPGVRVGRTLRDGDVVALGSLRLTVHTTPGHAPGSTSWSWTSCEGRICHAVVYADSLSALSSDAYRFSDHPAYVAMFRASLAKVARLSCDLIITPHPGASDLYDRLGGAKPLSDRRACIAYAAANRAKLEQRLASEAATTKKAARAGR